MTNAVSTTTAERANRISIGFLNWAHAIDHYVILIYTTVVISLQAVYGMSYAELIALSTPGFIAFGVFSLPFGWLADRYSRRDIMVAFYAGCGVSLCAAGFSSDLTMLTVALFALGVSAAIYHPVGMAMLIETSQGRGRTLAFNGVCGNLGVALAAGITGAITSWFGWRYAFLLPGILCIVTAVAYWRIVPDERVRGEKRKAHAQVPVTGNSALIFLALYVVISICGGLTFNTILISVPKIVDEKVGQGLSLLAVGGLSTAIFVCGAIGQLIVGRLAEKMLPALLFVIVVAMQVAGVVWAVNSSGTMLVAALAFTMAGIYGQVTTGDIVLARYTADAWRGRVYAVRYFLNFAAAGVAVPMLAYLYTGGGFNSVLWTIAAVTSVLLVAVIGFAMLVLSVESRHATAQPAE
jgi:MFS family permease